MKAFLMVILLSSGDDVLSLHNSLDECLQAERLAYRLGIRRSLSGKLLDKFL